ncbi:alpha/beta hydrolase [Desulfobacula sp.]|uniref:alpha/beta fold hydrolase n=1 Tax=Desulfobacula sp. TaxID=2593537 RepID=UPI0025B7C2D8|nr:alpha/beta hydrolase [Desulfobacula sp.]MBC2704666.1 alpha/beta hydrolase [Desulfobacula sp.]
MLEKKYYTGKVTLNYGEGLPNGVPLLLVHGSGSVWQDWTPVIDYFSNLNHVFAVDLRGFGGSDRISGSYKFPTFTNDIADFINGVIPTPPIIVGHSFGALITADLARRYPNIIKAIVLEDPPVSLLENLDQWEGWSYFDMALEMVKKKTSRQEAETRFIEEAGYSPAEAKRATRNLEQIDPEIFEQILYHNMLCSGENMSAILSRIQCPCLFISSNHALGSLVKPEDLPIVKKSLKNGNMAHITDAGHGIHIESPAAYNQALRKFLSGMQ